jgi:hypothetical protein
MALATVDLVSDEEILATVCRIIKKHTKNAPEKMDENTPLLGLRYKWEKSVWKHEPTEEERRERVGKNVTDEVFQLFPLMYDITHEFHAKQRGGCYWIWPESFDHDKTYKKVKTVGDVCKMVRQGYEKQAKYDRTRNANRDQKAALKAKLENVGLTDLDGLLCGKLPWEQVQKFFLEGEFHDEHYLVTAIRKFLLTPEQKALMAKHDMSIEDMLNGRTNGRQSQVVTRIYHEWNAKLGFHDFGFSECD